MLKSIFLKLKEERDRTIHYYILYKGDKRKKKRRIDKKRCVSRFVKREFTDLGTWANEARSVGTWKRKHKRIKKEAFM